MQENSGISLALMAVRLVCHLSLSTRRGRGVKRQKSPADGFFCISAVSGEMIPCSYRKLARTGFFFYFHFLITDGVYKKRKYCISTYFHTLFHLKYCIPNSNAKKSWKKDLRYFDYYRADMMVIFTLLAR